MSFYEKEMLEIYRFGLGLQYHYFKVGNEAILADADDPNDSYIVNLVKSNYGVMVNNSLNYLDMLDQETQQMWTRE